MMDDKKGREGYRSECEFKCIKYNEIYIFLYFLKVKNIAIS